MSKLVTSGRAIRSFAELIAAERESVETRGTYLRLSDLTTMQSKDRPLIAGVAILLVCVTLLLFFYALTTATGEWVGFWGNLFGGLIGASGAFLGVVITLQITDRQERAREKENAAEEMRRTRTAIEVEVLHFARQAFAIGGAFAKQGRTPTWRTAIWLSFFPAEPVLFNALAGRIGVYEPEKVRRLVGFYLGMQRIRARRLAWHAFPHDEPPPNAEYTTLYILVEHALQAAAKLLESLQVDEQPEPGKSLLSLLNETAESLRSQRQR